MRLKILCVLLFIGFRIQARPLKVVTINVWSGLDYIGNLKMGEYESKTVREQRYQLLVDQLKHLDPDVIALNEANPLPRYARQIARDLKYDHVEHVGVAGLHLGPIGLPVNLREGDVILAKKELNLRSAGRKQLSGGYVGRFFTCHFSDATQVVGATIEIDGCKIYLFNTHWHASLFATPATLAQFTEQYLTGALDSDPYLNRLADAVRGKEWRLMEARRMVAFIDKVAGNAPTIVMGDFNDLSTSGPITILKTAGFTDTFGAAGDVEGYTWDELFNTNIHRHYLMGKPQADARRDRIDYIFCRGADLILDSSQVVLNHAPNGLHPSDHFGVMTFFQVSDR